MGLFKGKLLAIGMFASLFAANVNAQEVAVIPMIDTDPLVAFEKSQQVILKQIEDAKNLDPVQKERIARELTDKVDEMRGDVGAVQRAIAILGKNVFVAGLIITYQGEMNYLSPWAFLSANPSAEAGVAVFLKKNEETVSASLRGSGVTILGAGADLNAGRSVVQRRAGLDKGWRLKVLVSNPDAKEVNVRGVNLTEFEGFWTGASFDVSAFGRDLGLQVYTKPETCTSLAPNSCSTYIFAFQGSKAEKQAAAIGAKEINLEFHFDNNGEGLGF